MFIKKLIVLFIGLIFFSAVFTSAAQAQNSGVTPAQNVTEWSSVTSSGFDTPYNIADSNERTWATSNGLSSVNVSYNQGIGSLYLVFDKVPGEWTIEDLDTGRSQKCGTDGFLHEFVDLMDMFGYLPKKVSLKFNSGASIDEVYVFSEGEVPEWVQVWNRPCDRADLLLFSSHSDDEQLFFAGVLPYYAGEREMNVQVVYMVNHFDVHDRPHEQLDGLWTVGVKNYPVISEFPDLYSTSLDGALSAFGAAGYEYNDFVGFITENIRRFKPLVIVSHDLNGEYGHGTHILCAKALTESLNYCGDASKFGESASLYGVCEPSKCYLHLYSENSITMDFDKPLEKFGGMTAFQVTQKGFECHDSQQWTWFKSWIRGSDANPITKATQIQTYSPCNYGLYKSTVGPDAAGGDFFENVKTYKEQDEEKKKQDETKEATPEQNDEKNNGKPDDKASGFVSNVRSFIREHSTYLTIVTIMTAVTVLLVLLVINHPQKGARRKY